METDVLCFMGFCWGGGGTTSPCLPKAPGPKGEGKIGRYDAIKTTTVLKTKTVA